MDNQHNPFQCNLGYQVSLSGVGEWNKIGDYIGRNALEKIKTDLATGKKPYRLQLVGLVFGGKPVEDFAHDFWSLSPATGGEACGFITSPWYHPDIKQNIAMGYVPFDGDLDKNGFPKGKIGQKFKAHLPDEYADTPDVGLVTPKSSPCHLRLRTTPILGKKHSSDMRTRLAAV